MKFMAVMSFPKESIEALISRGDPKPPDGIKYLGRWHTGTRKVFVLFEADDPLVLNKFIFSSADLLDVEVMPVVAHEDLGKGSSK